MRWIVSAKAVVCYSGQVLLALNDRNEWELPGGQLESGETVEECIEREVLEETALRVKADRVVRSWVHEVVPGAHVVIVAYGCTLDSSRPTPIASAEHRQVAFVPTDSLDSFNLPTGYREALAAWLNLGRLVPPV